MKVGCLERGSEHAIRFTFRSAWVVRGLGWVALSSLAACTTTPSIGAAPQVRPEPPVAQWLAQVRDQRGYEDAVEISPLRDARTEDLRARAAAVEAKGDPAAAAALIADALMITPDDPLLLQEAAELALHTHNWNRAIDLAARSYTLGPQLGPLCRRNWTIQRLLRDWQGDTQGAAQAGAQVAACTLAPPVRM